MDSNLEELKLESASLDVQNRLYQLTDLLRKSAEISVRYANRIENIRDKYESGEVITREDFDTFLSLTLKDFKSRERSLSSFFRAYDDLYKYVTLATRTEQNNKSS